MRVLVCGARDWMDATYLEETLDILHRGLGASSNITTVVEGCATGADDLAARWAVSRGIPVEHHPPHWGHRATPTVLRHHLARHPVPACEPSCRKLQGRRAGVIRNGEMLATGVDVVVAFHPNLSRSTGTADTVRRAQRAAIDLLIHTGPKIA